MTYETDLEEWRAMARRWGTASEVTWRDEQSFKRAWNVQQTRIAELESDSDSLTAKIDAAPHGDDCILRRSSASPVWGERMEFLRMEPNICDCWKASTGDDALRHVKAQALRDAGDNAHPVVVRWEDFGGNIEHMIREWFCDRADRIEDGE